VDAKSPINWGLRDLRAVAAVLPEPEIQINDFSNTNHKIMAAQLS
jgi:hypothetical protein